jgi:4-hydroxy-tetrahydrodipicolinate synthase
MPGMDLVDGVVALWKALQSGDEDTAYRLSYPICAIVALQLQAGLDGFLAIEKHLLVKRGIFPSARRRGPYAWELDTETAGEVERLFIQLQRVLDHSQEIATKTREVAKEEAIAQICICGLLCSLRIA